MKTLSTAVALLCLASALRGQDTTAPADDYFRAIRTNHLSALKKMSRSGLAGVKDKLGWTPLHFAALYGSADAVRILLAAGADPNARSRNQATPLIFAAYSLEKTRLLVEKGADVNATANDSSTPLWVAAGADGNETTVRYLLQEGANPKAIHDLEEDYLVRAAAHQNAGVLGLLVEKGLDPHHAMSTGDTALSESYRFGPNQKAALLLAKGADPNAANTFAGIVKNGPIDSTGITPLMLAAILDGPGGVMAEIKAGGKVDSTDHRHMTALMLAIATDRANVGNVQQLIDNGADVNVKDRYGETALDWAQKYRNPEILAALERAGAKGKGLPPAPVRPADYKPDATEAITRASALLANSAEAFLPSGGGCMGCHHQPFAGRAFGAIKAAGLPVEPRLRQVLINAMTIERPLRVNGLNVLETTGGKIDTLLYMLAAMAEMGEPATAFTDSMVHYIAETQDPSGVWNEVFTRPPLQESAITRTMLAIEALKTYGWPARRAEFEERMARARDWLLSARTWTTIDEADRLTGLWLGGADAAMLKKLAEKLRAQQRPDGGWAQTRNLESDAFGTAAVLHSLYKTGLLKVSDAAYRRGAQYLLDTQFPDGSWYVRSRAVKLQPYFQSGFPFDHDQWISNCATGYAVMALAPVAAER